MPLSRDEAAARLGMKTTEVTAVDSAADGDVVTTFDGVRTLVTADTVAPYMPDAAEGVADPEVPDAVPDVVPDEPVADDEPDEVSATQPQDGVPDGTADDVLAWVADDPARAAAALEVEQGRDKPRVVLAGRLEKLAAGA